MPFALSGPLFPRSLSLLDNNVPTRGPVTVTGRQQDNVVMDVAGEGSCLIWGGALSPPPTPVYPVSTVGLVGNCGTPVGGGNKTNKDRLNGIPENSDAAADTEKWFFIHATPLQEVLL